MSDESAAARPSERPARPRKSTARQVAEVLAIAVFALVVAEGLYLVFGNLYLRHVLPAQLNAEPGRQTVTWTRAWTWLPGLAHATDFRLVRQHPEVQWEVRAETARTQVGLLGLLVRRFR